MSEIGVLTDVLSWLGQAPPGTLVPAEAVAAMLRDRLSLDVRPDQSLVVREAGVATWRERLWTVPADTRLGVRELAEAAGRSRDWVYRHTAAGGTGARLPHRKLDGQLVFAAGEVRAWLRDVERVIQSDRHAG